MGKCKWKYYVVLLTSTLFLTIDATTSTTTATPPTTTTTPITTTTTPTTTTTTPTTTTTTPTTTTTTTTTTSTTTTTPTPWQPTTIIESANFLANGEHIFVGFNETLRFNDYTQCDQYFSPETIQQLGGKSLSCRLASAKHILVTPFWSSNVRPGHELHSNASYFINSSIEIDAFTALRPTFDIRLSGPNENLCSCTNEHLSFNIDLSENLGYGSLRSISWELVWISFLPKPMSSTVSSLSPQMSSTSIEIGSNANSPPSISTVSVSSSISLSSSFQTTLIPTPTSSSIINTPIFTSAILPNLPTQRMPSSFNFTPYVHPYHLSQTIKLPASIFNQSNVYQLSVTARNVFGQIGHAVRNLTFSCSPSSQLHRVAHEDLYYEMIQYYPSCWTGGQNRTFEWNYSSQSISLLGDESPTNVNVFVIKRHLLTAGTVYDVTVHLNESSIPRISELAQTYSHQPEPIRAFIVGNSISIGINNTLVLDSSMSGDPDSVSSEEESRSWQCTKTDGSHCKFRNDSQWSNSGSTVLKLPLSDIFVEVGERYTFQLTYTKGAHSSQTEASVLMLSQDHPQLVVATMNGRVSNATPVLFTAHLIGRLSGTLSYVWSCHDTKDPQKKNLIPSGLTKSGSISIDAGVALSQTRLSSLLIPPNTFKRDFRMLCMCNSTQNSASDAVEYFVIRAPALSIEPNSGHAYSTEFTLRVRRFLSGFDNSALSFRFGYFPDASTIPVQYLSGWTSRNIISNIRFASLGISETSNLKVFAQIRNHKGILHQVETTLEVTRQEDNTLLSQLSEATRHVIDYNLYQSANLLTNRLLVTPNLNSISIRNVIPSDDIQTDFIKFIEYYISYPLLPEATQTAVDTIRYLVKKSSARLHPIMVNKIVTFLKHVSSSVMGMKGDVDYGVQAKTVLEMLEIMLVYPGSHDIVKPVLSQIATDYLMKITEEQVSPYYTASPDNDIFNSKLGILFTFHTFASGSSSNTILQINESIKKRFSTWQCVGDTLAAADNCTGFYTSQLKYEGSLYDGYLLDRYTGGAITDVYQLDTWYLHPLDRKLKPFNITHNGTLVEVNFPLKDSEVLVNDEIQCLIWDDNLSAFNESECVTDKLLSADKVTCKCRRLGLMTARRTPPLFPPTTEMPYPGANLTYDMYFYADEERCEDARQFGFFKPKFKAQLCELLGIIDKSRMKITGCTPGSIIVHFYIIDVVGKKRNSEIKPLLDEIIEEQTFRVQMNQGDDIWMFDVAQTTPKPPPPTIPPIGEVTVDWLPIGIAIGALGALFILCIVATYIYHTRQLRNKKFNKVNSNKKDQIVEEPKDKKLIKRQNQEKINNIIDEDLDYDEANDGVDIDSTNQRAAYTKKDNSRKQRNAIAPISDSNAIAITTNMSNQAYMSFQARQQGIKEPPRLALDDEEDEAEVAKIMKERQVKVKSKARKLLAVLQATKNFADEIRVNESNDVATIPQPMFDVQEEDDEQTFDVPQDTKHQPDTNQQA